MVKGLDMFKTHFEEYTDQYILIGGTACDLRFAEKDLNFRATKDLDIIIVVEALTNEFVRAFWEFIRAGDYEIAEIDSRKCFYRFIKPKTDGFPKMLELFSRRPEILSPVEGIHITDIPTGEDVSSLSAILMDDDYYHFTVANSNTVDGVHAANDVALIALKARAFLNNRQRKNDGQPVQDVDITKHKNDVIRLTATITGSPANAIAENIQRDIKQFIDIFQSEQDNIKDVLKPLNFGNITTNQIVDQLRLVFGI